MNSRTSLPTTELKVIIAIAICRGAEFISMMLPPYFQYFQVTEICTPGAQGAAAQYPELRRHLILSGFDIEVFAILMIKESNIVYQILIIGSQLPLDAVVLG